MLVYILYPRLLQRIVLSFLVIELVLLVQVFLQNVHLERSKDNTDVIKEVASTLENLGQYEYAIKFYLMIEDVAVHNDVSSRFASF